jgi:hypothetical protein
MGLIRLAIALAALVFLGRRLYFFIQPPPFPTTEVPLPKTFVGCEITDPPTSETAIEAIVGGATDPLPPSAVAGTITINGRHEVRNDLACRVTSRSSTRTADQARGNRRRSRLARAATRRW